MSDLAMETGGVDDPMRVLSGTGERFGAAWTAHEAAIGAGEGGLGTDRLAAAFRPTYQPAADAVRAAAGRMAAAYESAAAAGSTSATDYQATDATAAQRFEAFGG